jgi:hypothetical protein
MCTAQFNLKNAVPAIYDVYTYISPGLTLRNAESCPQIVFIFRMMLGINREYFRLSSLTGCSLYCRRSVFITRKELSF